MTTMGAQGSGNIICCGKRFKTVQGRAGHMQFKHGVSSRTPMRSAQQRTDEQLNSLIDAVIELKASVAMLEVRVAELEESSAAPPRPVPESSTPSVPNRSDTPEQMLHITMPPEQVFYVTE